MKRNCPLVKKINPKNTESFTIKIVTKLIDYSKVKKIICLANLSASELVVQYSLKSNYLINELKSEFSISIFEKKCSYFYSFESAPYFVIEQLVSKRSAFN